MENLAVFADALTCKEYKRTLDTGKDKETCNKTTSKEIISRWEKSKMAYVSVCGCFNTLGDPFHGQNSQFCRN